MIIDKEEENLLRPKESGKKSESDRVKELQDHSRHIIETQSFMNANISYKLVDIDEILYTYDDSIIKLNNILTNCIKAKIKEEAQDFIKKLNEAIYITRLWSDCQYKWLFLEKIYAMANWNKDQSIYNQINKDFRNFQFRVADNPIVLNIISRADNANNLSQWHKQMVRLFLNSIFKFF